MKQKLSFEQSVVHFPWPASKDVPEPFNEFVNAHGYECEYAALGVTKLWIDDLAKHRSCYVKEFVDKVFKQFGYTIEVTEVSTASKSVGTVADGVWEKSGTYRWKLAYWNNDGVMRKLYHDENQYASEDEAFEKAANYIINTYKEWEK